MPCRECVRIAPVRVAAAALLIGLVVSAGAAVNRAAAQEKKKPTEPPAAGPAEQKPATEEQGGSAKDQELFREVVERLLQTEQVRKHFPPNFQFPPKTHILPKSAKVYNAFAEYHVVDPATKKILTKAVVTEGYMDHIVKGDADVLAAVMGHELAHIIKRHAYLYGKKELTTYAFSREQEIEADLEGVKIAVAGGFPYRSGIRNAYRAWKVFGEITNFEGVKATHPTWVERLRLLDRDQAHIWQAMAAFRNGYYFLHMEQYRTAETCFEDVVEEFPECGEAWANLGYARLMQYCDGLEAKDLRGLGIGQIAAGCFYDRPPGLAPTVRGGDEKLWRAAVQALETALRRQPKLVLPNANLGLAYLVHPQGKQPELALEHFGKAYTSKDKGLNDLSLAALLINFGVAEQALGRSREAADKFRAARTALLAARKSDIKYQVEDALLYNEALVLAGGDREGQGKAFETLQVYLSFASPDSTWWPLAHEHYEKLGTALARKPAPRADLAKRVGGNVLRLVTSVEVAPGKLITVSDSTPKTLTRLGRARSVGIPIFHRSKVKRYFEVSPGVDLLAGEQVLAVFLTSDQAPRVTLQATGVGARKRDLRVGMPVGEFLEIIKSQPTERRFVDDPTITYLFVSDLGLGARLGPDRVEEMVLAVVPRKLGP
ncbi:MAG: M48 family metalloprotease [Gemmataceae bacterium]|nr:M48 family metalloprotease [Gemmataceae bacterium]